MNKSYLTARARKTLSMPAKILTKMNLINGEALDYGCGQGTDAKILVMDKYDPYYYPDSISPFKQYDTITCTYVLNVIDNEAERGHVLEDINTRLKKGGVAYITVRRDVKASGYTQRGTWQGNIELDLPIVKEYKGSFVIYKMSKIPISYGG